MLTEFDKIGTESKNKRLNIEVIEKLKWFNDAKGYGFITPDDGGEDLFAHFSAIKMDGFKTLKQGQRVTFDLNEGEKGKQADNIKPA